MTALFIAAWQALTGAAIGGGRAVVRAVKGSRTLQIIAGAIVAGLIAFFGIDRAIKKARREGEEKGKQTILDRIEEDSKHALEKIEEAGRDLSQEIGPAPVYEDAGDGRGLVSDDLNSRERNRLRELAAGDPRNRGNPREDPRS